MRRQVTFKSLCLFQTSGEVFHAKFYNKTSPFSTTPFRQERLRNSLSRVSFTKACSFGGGKARAFAEFQNPKKDEHRLIQKLDESKSTGSSSSEAHDKNHEIKTGAIKSELRTILQAFSLKDIPKESLNIGAAGVIPFAATSGSTSYLAWETHHVGTTDSGFLFSTETAQYLLEAMSTIQIGYGALIISCLGAIHLGFEYAEYGGRQGYRRLIYGVIAPLLALPTLLMPVEAALISQFLALNFMYFTDFRATVRGWFPPWYSIYRFFLTFCAGSSIVLSLIFRGYFAG
ncbi:putative fungal protein [Blumeria hordei DH14]|uniref:Putative fungal protein n=1 Tax=Blumeria graminis f. sp. hordei (strain DH14) TaxID=546991 RepID=N1J7V3_BLUG1|nr:putative fungal protein [Blumeria hordei DH14]